MLRGSHKRSKKVSLLNSLIPGDTSMAQWARSSMGRAMACRLSRAMLVLSYDRSDWTLKYQNINSSSKASICKNRLPNVAILFGPHVLKLLLWSIYSQKNVIHVDCHLDVCSPIRSGGQSIRPGQAGTVARHLSQMIHRYFGVLISKADENRKRRLYRVWKL